MKSLTEIHQAYLTTAYQGIFPEMVLVGGACLLFLLGAFTARRTTALGISLLTLVGAAIVATIVGPRELTSFWEPVAGTSFTPYTLAPFDPTGAAAFVRWIALSAAFLFILIGYAETRPETAFEYYGCLLVVTTGVSLVGRANDLISLFLALEMISIPTYVLLYLPSRTRVGQEAAAKYFLLSVLSSAVLLFGMSYLYGVTGSTNLGAISDTLTDANKRAVSPMASVAMILVIAGLGFRLTAVPFQFYAPDVYQGGPTGVVAQLALVPKVAGFIALARVLGMLLPPIREIPFDAAHTLIPLTLWVIAVATMTFGNILALLQDNLKRLLAYSGVAHGGYMLIGLVAASSLPESTKTDPMQTGVDAILFYLVAYGLMTVGVFALLVHLNSEGTEVVESVDDLGGLGQKRPGTALMWTIFLLSMIGLPLTAGFMGKFLLFVAAFEAPVDGVMKSMYRILAVIAAVNAAIGAVYYLRLIGIMYLQAPLQAGEKKSPSLAWLAAVLCAVGTVVLGVYPKPVTDAARLALPTVESRPAPAVVDAGKPTP